MFEQIIRLHLILSLAVTPVVLWYSLRVATKYGKIAIQNHNNESAPALLINGIAASFTGKLFDNLFWAVAWSAYMVGHGDYWFHLGPLAVLWFRQVPLVVSARYHLRAEKQSHTMIRTTSGSKN